MVSRERKLSVTATALLLGFIALFLFGWYEMLSTPQTSMAIFLAGVVLTIWAWLYTTSEFMPANVMKSPNFITRAGAIGAFHSIEHYEGGQSKAFVSVRRAYAYDNGLKPRPRNLFDAIGSSLTPNAIVEVVGNTNDFEDIPRGVCDAREGAVFFWGSLNPDKRIPSEYEELKAKNNRFEVLIKELVTVYENAKAVSGKLSEEEAKSLIDTSLKATAVLSNLTKTMKQQQPQQFQERF